MANFRPEDVKLKKSTIESEMLSKLAEIDAEDKIDNVSSEEDYGFIKSGDELTAAKIQSRLQTRMEKSILYTLETQTRMIQPNII